MTFKVYNYSSMYPYLLNKMGFVDSQFGTTVAAQLRQRQRLFWLVLAALGRNGNSRRQRAGGDAGFGWSRREA